MSGPGHPWNAEPVAYVPQVYLPAVLPHLHGDDTQPMPPVVDPDRTVGRRPVVVPERWPRAKTVLVCGVAFTVGWVCAILTVAWLS